MNCIIASTSTVHGSAYLEYLEQELMVLFSGVQEVVFIPYARPSGISHDDYTAHARPIFNRIGKTLKGIHSFNDPKDAIENAKAIFVGGGNTFLLVKTLHDLHVMDVLKEAIKNGVPYLGTSAGSNICGINMQTTNDMPIVKPSSFETMGILPFNINAHYTEPDPKLTHKGETRRTRIKEFQNLNAINVLGLKEGSWIQISGHNMQLKGNLEAVWFKPNAEPEILQPNHIFS